MAIIPELTKEELVRLRDKTWSNLAAAAKSRDANAYQDAFTTVEYIDAELSRRFDFNFDEQEEEVEEILYGKQTDESIS